MLNFRPRLPRRARELQHVTAVVFKFHNKEAWYEGV